MNPPHRRSVKNAVKDEYHLTINEEDVKRVKEDVMRSFACLYHLQGCSGDLLELPAHAFCTWKAEIHQYTYVASLLPDVPWYVSQYDNTLGNSVFHLPEYELETLENSASYKFISRFTFEDILTYLVHIRIQRYASEFKLYYEDAPRFNAVSKPMFHFLKHYQPNCPPADLRDIIKDLVPTFRNHEGLLCVDLTSVKSEVTHG